MIGFHYGSFTLVQYNGEVYSELEVQSRQCIPIQNGITLLSSTEQVAYLTKTDTSS